MKKSKLQTKRKTQKGVRAMYARTVGRKVKASAVASAEELDGDVPSVGIGKALTVILILHLLAIAAIAIGTNWKDNKKGDVPSKVLAANDEGNDELETTKPNVNPGKVTVDTPFSYNMTDGSETNITQNVEPRPRDRLPRVIKPRRNPNKSESVTPSNVAAYMNYTVQKGDNFYRIAKKYDIKQRDLIKMNPNVKASRMKIGMTIKIPKK